MSAQASRLPPGFEALEPFVDMWTAATSAERDHWRGARSEAERLAFYTAAKDLAPAALGHLDQKPLNQFDEKEQRLMLLMLNLVHVSLAVEVQRDAEPAHAQLRALMPIVRSSADHTV